MFLFLAGRCICNPTKEVWDLVNDSAVQVVELNLYSPWGLKKKNLYMRGDATMTCSFLVRFPHRRDFTLHDFLACSRCIFSSSIYFSLTNREQKANSTRLVMFTSHARCIRKFRWNWPVSQPSIIVSVE